MAKKRKKIDTRQRNLFEYLDKVRALEEAPSEGTLGIREPLRQALNQAIKACPRSRHQIAGEMSHLLGCEINKTTIDSWTAESKAGNRIPAEYLPAFCKATGSRQALTVVAEAAGVFALPGPDALRSEIQRLVEEEKKVRAQKRRRQVLLEELERERNRHDKK